MDNLTFGPVVSRRFGVSLGVDLSPHAKQCNFDCLYCELSPAKPVDRAIDVPQANAYLEAIVCALKKYPQADYITLTANGEPTLYPYLEELVVGIKSLHVKQKLLILSNSATLCNANIARILSTIDVVKLSLDAADEKTFKRLDRPFKGLHVKDIIASMEAFSRMYCGTLVLEVLVVKGVNDTEAAFDCLNAAIGRIQPARVDVGTIARPPAYQVEGVDVITLHALAARIAGVPVNVAQNASYAQKHDFDEVGLMALLDKRPQSTDDVKYSFSSRSQILLKGLVSRGKVRMQTVAGMDFYRV